MEATIEIKEHEYDDFRFESYKGLFGWKQRRVDLGRKTKYILSLTLLPSEEEKAIILKYKLDELAVETESEFTQEELDEFEQQMRSGMGELSEEGFQSTFGPVLAERRQRKKQTVLAQYFDNPFTKSFVLRQDAHSYADKLENEILPLIKTQIDYYQLESFRKDKRTISL